MFMDDLLEVISWVIPEDYKRKIYECNSFLVTSIEYIDSVSKFDLIINNLKEIAASCKVEN